MDAYTIVRLYEITLHNSISNRPLNKVKTDASYLLSSLSTMLSETCKKIDSHKCILLSDKGEIEIIEHMNAPVPDSFMSKRFMKSNTRSSVKDIIKVLFVLLGINVVSEQTSIHDYSILFDFIV